MTTTEPCAAIAVRSWPADGFGRAAWRRLTWPATLYRECVFARTRIPPQASFGNARFERCVFDGARLRDLIGTHKAQFVECTFRGKTWIALISV